jgi:hypothetical protein
MTDEMPTPIFGLIAENNKSTVKTIPSAAQSTILNFRGKVIIFRLMSGANTQTIKQPTTLKTSSTDRQIRPSKFINSPL